jgi:hypothetical protein
MHIGFWWERQKERDHYEDLDIGRRIIIRWILREIRWGHMDRIDLAQGRDQWRALKNTAINLWVPSNTRNILSSCKIGSFSIRVGLHK